MTAGRTLSFGRYFCDHSLAKEEHKMPPQAYSRAEPMSDRLQSILANPYFLVSDAATWLNIDIRHVRMVKVNPLTSSIIICQGMSNRKSGFAVLCDADAGF